MSGSNPKTIIYATLYFISVKELKLPEGVIGKLFWMSDSLQMQRKSWIQSPGKFTSTHKVLYIFSGHSKTFLKGNHWILGYGTMN